MYGRIHKQHLNDIYTETRFAKTTKVDAFQVSCLKFNKQNKQYIDKSSLRKSIGRVHQIAPGKETADYIRNHFIFYTLIPMNSHTFKKDAVNLIQSIIPNIEKNQNFEDTISFEVTKGIILALETIMIANYKPLYNTQNKA